MPPVLLGLGRMMGFGRDQVQRARFVAPETSSLLPLGRKLKTKDSWKQYRPLSVHLSTKEVQRVCPTQTAQRPRGRVCLGHLSCLLSHLLPSHGKYSRASPGCPVDCHGIEGQVGTFSICYISYSHHGRGTREQGFPAKPLLTCETHQPLLSCLL